MNGQSEIRQATTKTKWDESGHQLPENHAQRK